MLTETEFHRKVRRAQMMANLRERTDYLYGYVRGLQRLYHGEDFGTEEEHKEWMQLIDDADEERQTLGWGYRDALVGNDPGIEA